MAATPGLPSRPRRVAQPEAAAAARLHQVERGRGAQQALRPLRTGPGAAPVPAVASGPSARISNSRAGRRRAAPASRRSRRTDRTARVPGAAPSAASAGSPRPSAGSRACQQAVAKQRPSAHAERSQSARRDVAAVASCSASKPGRGVCQGAPACSSFRPRRAPVPWAGIVGVSATIWMRSSAAPGQAGIESTASATRRFRCNHRAGTPSSRAAFGRPSAASRPIGLPISSALPATSRRSSATWIGLARAARRARAMARRRMPAAAAPATVAAANSAPVLARW